jgi:hypothetical protein
MNKLKVKVSNMQSPMGNAVENQFAIQTPEGKYLQSYLTLIAFKPVDKEKFFSTFLSNGKDSMDNWDKVIKRFEDTQEVPHIYLDRSNWEYSVTTGKYRNQFLMETKKETEAKIKSGEYALVDLN